MRRHASIACALAIGLVAVFGAGPAAAAGCPNEGIRAQQGVAHLPECRAYEMVSPVEKGGVDVLGDTQRPFTEAGPDGNSIAYASSAAFGDAQGSPFPSIYRATRGGDGWSSTMASPPQNATIVGGSFGGTTSVVYGFNPDLTKAIVRTNRSLVPGAGESVPNLFRRDLLTDSYDLLSPGGPATPSFTTPSPELVWATPDLSAVVFSSREALTADAPSGSGYKTYAYRNGSLQLASVLPNGTPTTGASGTPNQKNSAGAISADGRYVFFAGGEGQQGLWVRDLDAQTTIEIAEPSVMVEYLAASEDGSQVLWRAREPVANVDTLFLYDADSGSTITVPDGELSDGTSPVFSTLAVSSDLSSIYFVAQGKWVAGQPDPPADSPVIQPKGIYRWQPAAERLTFVAYFGDGSTGGSFLEFEGGIFENLVFRRDVATTKDGSVLAFMTDAKVMPPSGSSYDNKSSSPACYDLGAERCREVYRFDAGAESVECVSCPSGPPTAGAGLAGATAVAGPSTVFQRSFAQAHAVSADGSKVFFETAERLAPGDTNGRDDVYMWEAGSQRLLSSGSSEYPSRLLDASPDGDDVFFVTRAPLVGRDRDELADVYDARVGGGFPEPEPEPGTCQASGCQRSTAAPPPRAAASSTTVGPGNPRCHRVVHRRAARLHTRARKLRHRSHREARRSRSTSRRLAAKARRLDKRARRAQTVAKRCGGVK